MSERYTKIFSLPENLHAESSPLVIKAGALLKDNETGSLIGQLKLQNSTNKIIKSTKVKLVPYNRNNNTIGNPVEYEYSDVNASYGTIFGTQSPISFPYSNVSSYTVYVTEVTFKDGAIWTDNEESYESISQHISTSSITTNSTASEKYKNNQDDISKLQKKKTLLKILVPCSIVMLAVLSYFVVYPMVARMTGNYEAYTDIYNSKDIKISKGTKEIKANAFKDNQTIESVTIPGSVKTIGKNAFMSCRNLKDVTIEDGVTTIESHAFFGCDSLTSITIPDSVTTIGDSAFYGCSSLTTIIIGKNVTTIGAYAFRDCNNVTSLVIGKNVTSIGTGAFRDLDNITSLTIPNSVTSIGMFAFFDCDKVANVVIGNGVTTIQKEAFAECSAITSITLPNSVVTIDERVFNYCSNLENIVIGNNVTKIGELTFRNCHKLTDIYYTGSQAEWSKIDKCYISDDITIHFNYVPD